MPAISTRAELEARLRANTTRLVVRQVVRATFTGVAGAALALMLAVVFLDVLPRLLFGVRMGAGALLAVTAAGFGIAVALHWRRYRLPTLQDTALALEARLDRDSGALAAVLRVDENSRFFRPLLANALGDLQQAEHADAPVLISTRKLVLVPLIALAAGIAFVVALNTSPPEGRAPLAVVPAQDNREAWRNIDTGSSRSDADHEAYRKALGLETAAATLSHSAETLRNAQATDDSKQQALDEARTAAGDASATVTSLPEKLPADTAAQTALAKEIEAMADGLGVKASELKAGKTDSPVDSGGNGKFKPDATAPELVPFPKVAITSDLLAGETLATQTPARRAMAARALKALENIQNR